MDKVLHVMLIKQELFMSQDLGIINPVIHQQQWSKMITSKSNTV